MAIDEGLIGGRVAAWVGAALVMIGAGVFVKYAYDQGWLRQLGSLGRFTLATGGALVLVVLGEVALRRYGRAAAAGLFAAGVGSLLVIAAAGTLPDVMKVYGPGGAALYAIGATILGVVITKRSGLLTVGIVVIAGAYLVPIFAGILRMDSALAAPSYLTAILVMALVLATFVPGQGPVRYVALVFHLLLGALFLMLRSPPPLVKEAFVMLWWGLFVMDAIVAVSRSIPGGEGEAAHSSSSAPPFPPAPRSPPTAPPTSPLFASTSTPPSVPPTRMGTASLEPVVVVIVTLAATMASFAFAGAWAGWRDLWAWLPAAQAVICVAAAGHLHAMRGERGRSHAVDEMITALVIIGAALIGCAVALLLQPRAASVAWAMMGGAAVVVAARNHSRLLAWLGACALIPACAVAAWQAFSARHLHGGATFAELPLPGLSGASLVFAPNWWLPVLVAVVAFVAGILVRPMAAPGVRDLLAVTATVAWAAVALALDRGGSGLLVASLLPVAFFALERWRNDPFALRAATATALLLLIACATLAIVMGVDIGLNPHPMRSDGAAPRAIALMIAIGILVSSTSSSNVGALVAIAIALVVIGFVEVNGGAHRGGRVGDRAAAEVSVFAALAALVSIAGSALKRGHWWQPIALWSALAWLWASIVLVLRAGLDDSPPMANLMNATAALVLSALGVSLWARRDAIAACTFVVVVIVAGSWDLVRLAPRLTTTALDVETLRQALLSAWWALVAVVAVIAGFAWRLTALRWMALAILAITAAKVLLVDLQRAATLARVGALLAVGLLMVVTSVVYARAERRLRAQPTPEE